MDDIGERDLDSDPIAILRDWLAEAGHASLRPDAVTLATATADGAPSARVVLLRGLDERGLVFFTNRVSRKGRELEENPRAALLFHWPELGRQIRVEGAVEPVSEEESREYWQTRPRPSQIAAWASPQSQPIPGREALDELYAATDERFGGQEVPLPELWGGYRVRPESFEFWMHRENRLHDRLRYVQTAEGWRRERLAP